MSKPTNPNENPPDDTPKLFKRNSRANRGKVCTGRSTYAAGRADERLGRRGRPIYQWSPEKTIDMGGNITLEATALS